MPTFLIPVSGSLVINGAVKRIPQLNPGSSTGAGKSVRPNWLNLSHYRPLHMQGTEIDEAWRRGFGKRPVPLFIDGSGIFATHTQAQDLPRRSIMPVATDRELSSVPVANLFE